MKNLKIIFVVFILMNVTFAWTLPKVNGQDYYSQEDPNKEILKDAVVGAGVGAVASSASGGSAGKGALIGAGTNVIGNALIDTLTSPPRPQPQVQYVQQTSERGYTVVDNSPRRGGCDRNR